MDNQKITELLNNLVTVLKDADLGFHAAAEEVRDAKLKTLLHQQSQKCSTIRGSVEKEVRSAGGEPDNEGTFTGKCQRIWTEVKTAFTDKDEAVVLKDCVSAQESVHEEFSDVLGTDGLPSNVKETIGRLFDDVQAVTKTICERCEHFDSIQNS